jgi:hypothetical protein
MVVFSKSHCWIMDHQKHKHIIAVGHRDSKNGLYSFEKMTHANIVEKVDTQILWHRRYGPMDI